MNIKRCDKCKREIKSREKHIYVSTEGWIGSGIELCAKCGAPVLSFLKKSKLVKENKN